jgi:hypothetical protein
MEPLQLDRKHPIVARIISLVASDYKGRKPVKIYTAEKHNIEDYWDGGSRTYAFVVDLVNMCRCSLSDVGFVKQTINNPYNQNMGEVILRPGFAIVERVYFCGKDLGIRLYVHQFDLGLFKQE